MLKMLYLGVNFKNYGAAYYQNDLLNCLDHLYQVKCWGPGFKAYNKDLTIKQVIKAINFVPDLILISNTWEIQNTKINEFDINPKLKLYETSIPKLFFMNKEYKKLEIKLNFIIKNKINYITTVLKNKCSEWENITGSHFIWEPFGINLDRIDKNNNKIIDRKYDIGFTGNLHQEWIDERIKIKEHLFQKKYMNFKKIHNLSHTKRFKPKYANLKIYWGEWNEKKLFLPVHRRTPFGKKYFKILIDFKISLNTKSAIGIFNPRFFELMASKTLILCPRDKYDGILVDKLNCVMYSDLSDFDNKLFYYSNNDDKRIELVNNAYNDVFKYQWEKIIEDLFVKIDFRN